MRHTQRMPASTTRRTSTPRRLELLLAHAVDELHREHGVGAGLGHEAGEVRRPDRRRSCAVKRRLCSASLARWICSSTGVAERAQRALERHQAQRRHQALERAADEEQDRAVERDLLEDVRPAHLDRDHLPAVRAARRGAPAPPTRRRRARDRSRRRPPRAGGPSSLSTVARTAANGKGGTRSRSSDSSSTSGRGSRSARVEAICPTLMNVAPSVVQSRTSARPSGARRDLARARRRGGAARSRARRRAPAATPARSHLRRAQRDRQRARRAAPAGTRTAAMETSTCCIEAASEFDAPDRAGLGPAHARSCEARRPWSPAAPAASAVPWRSASPAEGMRVVLADIEPDALERGRGARCAPPARPSWRCPTDVSKAGAGRRRSPTVPSPSSAASTWSATTPAWR